METERVRKDRSKKRERGKRQTDRQIEGKQGQREGEKNTAKESDGRGRYRERES